MCVAGLFPAGRLAAKQAARELSGYLETLSRQCLHLARRRLQIAARVGVQDSEEAVQQVPAVFLAFFQGLVAGPAVAAAGRGWGVVCSICWLSNANSIF